jgi:hypothetical protein
MSPPELLAAKRGTSFLSAAAVGGRPVRLRRAEQSQFLAIGLRCQDSLTAQDCVFMPQHRQLSLLGCVAAQQDSRQLRGIARKQPCHNPRAAPIDTRAGGSVSPSRYWPALNLPHYARQRPPQPN